MQAVEDRLCDALKKPSDRASMVTLPVDLPNTVGSASQVASGVLMFVIRLLLLMISAAAGYALAVAAAFAFWSWTGASGPDYTPLLVVLFVIAPVVALITGVSAAAYPKRRRGNQQRATASKWGRTDAPDRQLPAKRMGSLQIGIIAACALIIGFVILALGPTPLLPLISR
jgi:hypothetical protein